MSTLSPQFDSGSTQHEAITSPATGPAGAKALQTGWREAVLTVAAHYQLNASAEHIRLVEQWANGSDATAQTREMARQAGLSLQMLQPSLAELTPWRLPVVLELTGGQVAVVTAMADDTLTLMMSGDGGTSVSHTLAALQPHVHHLAVLRPLQNARDARVDDYIAPVEDNWLRKLVLVDWRPYAHILVASLVTNLMALGGVLFSMQVYDRVVPAQSMPTLYVLFGGVMLSLLFAYVMRDARMRITDVLRKRADLRISDRVFGHALRVKNSARPQSTGTFISQIRELESVRDMLTSTTIAAAADLPFFFLFCGVFWMIGGWLVMVPLGALVLLLVPSLLAQKRLRDLAQMGTRESALRNAMLVEAVQGIEDIKVLQAENRFQNQWNHYNAVNANSGLQLRELLNRLNNWMQTVQGGAFAVVIFFGVPAVLSGSLSTGVLVASSILVSRMLAPLSSITSVMNRWQQAKVAAQSLDQLMKLPVDNPQDANCVHRPALRGDFAIKEAGFTYDGQNPALSVKSLKIDAGERVALLGRNGAGKSTLLQALSGLMQPHAGSVLLDGVEMAHIDPADVRRDVSLLSQSARLFHGTVRENLKLGAPLASDEQLITALQASGAWAYVQSLPLGLDHPLQEGGIGMSGGQRQALLLARMLLREPRVLLLDEPTAAMDELTERGVIEHLRSLPKDCTIILATHRMALLDAVDRILVMDGGTLVMDGPKAQVIAALRGAQEDGSKGQVAAQKPPAASKPAGLQRIVIPSRKQPAAAVCANTNTSSTGENA